LIQGNLAERADTVCQPHREAHQTRSAAYERASVLNQLDILSEILTRKGQDTLAGQVSRLRVELEK